MEKFVEQTLLYDFYGDLLTKRQQEVYEDVILNDCSVSEVAGDLGISRQGVHDMIRRCSRSLEQYEARLHLVEKFLRVRGQARQILQLAREYEAEDIAALAKEILEEL